MIIVFTNLKIIFKILNLSIFQYLRVTEVFKDSCGCPNVEELKRYEPDYLIDDLKETYNIIGLHYE
jgi:hypothetical protein